MDKQSLSNFGFNFDIKLPKELYPLVEEMAKMCMRCGPSTALPRDGLMGRNATTQPKNIRALYPMMTFPKAKKNTTAPRLKRL